VAFTYDPDLSTDRDRIRFRLRDTDPAHPFFSDAQIADLLADGGTYRRAVAEGARVLLMERARFAHAQPTLGDANGTAAPNPHFRDPEFTTYLEKLIAEYGGGVTTLPLAVVTHIGSHPTTPEL
jgi:hypothetical protein